MIKILYAIQGTGNGHISRARVLGPELENHCQVDYLISGRQVDLDLRREVKFRINGLSLYFGKKGGVDISRTVTQNNAGKVYKEIGQLPVENYDLIINDFEPISAWAGKRKGIKCVALSHQSALLSPLSPRPQRKDPFGMAVLNHYAPADVHYGFHFDRFDQNIFTPVIRKDLREFTPTNEGHITVYLPSYDDQKILSVLSCIKNVNWEVFSKYCSRSTHQENIRISPIHDRKYAESLISCKGLLCGAGFESPSEALFLGKNLMVIPMKNQYEQQCNAEALNKIGIPVIKKLSKKFLPQITQWIENGTPVHVNYPDETKDIVEKLMTDLYG